MYQRFKLLILFLCVIASATAVFGANAARVGNNVGNNQAHMVSLDSRQQPLTDGGYKPSSSAIGNKSNASQTALGFYMSPGIMLGTTTCDLQHYSRMARQIAVGADGRVHFVWTFSYAPYNQYNRSVHYTSYKDGILNWPPQDVSGNLDKMPGRFCTVDVFQNRGLVVNHYGSVPTITSALDIASGAHVFQPEDPPSTVINCQWELGDPMVGFQPYIWPVVAADQDGAGKLIIHIAGMENNTSADFKAITYFRGVSSGTNIEDGMYGACGTFIDQGTAIGYDIAASPYNDDVVIAYPKARQANNEDNDLAYRLSNNMGAAWGPVVNVTNFLPGAKERCGQEVSVLFTADNCFHILWLGTIYDSEAGTVSDQEVKLWHWSSCYPTLRSLVLDANNHDNACNTPAFEYNVCKINLTQCNSSVLHDTLLYATYTRYLGTTDWPDCSQGGYSNGEVFISPSNTWGETWGAPVNLTNTKTDGCPAGFCADDRYTSAARYSTDSLRIEYMEDLDAGSFAGNESGTADLNNPVKFLSFPCIDMADYRILTCTPDEIKYPFHAIRNVTATQDLVLVNGGNLYIDWTSSLVGGDCPVTLVPASGWVPAGYTNSATITATVGPRSTEGLFHNTIRFTYDTPTKTLDVPVDFYVFDVWFLEQDVSLRTANNRMVVNQVGQAADNTLGSSFTYFVDNTEDFIKDASLIMGNSAQNLSWRIFESGQGDPTPGNNFGWLYALSNTDADSTTFPSYRVAWGKGTNRDSTVGYDVKWYAPKHADSADFYVGHFEVYKGTKWTSNVTNLGIAFACDWDVPADSSSSDNSVGTDPARQMIYLQGTGTGLPGTTYIPRDKGYGALAAYREDGVPIAGGFAWGNKEQVYPNRGYHVDSVWKYMQLMPGYTSLRDTTTDQSIVMVVAKNYTVTSTSRLVFDVVLAAQRAQYNPNGLAGLNLAVDKAKKFICTHLGVTSLCICTDCGDANNDGEIDISDAVFLISYIYSGGAAPADCNYPFGMGDANGDGRVSVADAIFLIGYMFSGGPAPHCADGYQEPGHDTGVRDTIAIMCPTIVPSDHLVAGDSFRVEVYLYNDEIINGLSAGFSYNSDLIEITSADFGGSIIPVGAFREWKSDPANKRFLIGHVRDSLNTYIPARTQRGLLCALNVRMLPSIRAGVVDIDTAFVLPAGYFELVSAYGPNSYVPVYADCGVSDIQLGDGSVTNLVAFYNFNEGSGSVAHDASGNGNHGTLKNNPTWIDGITGAAIDLNGVNEYVEIPDAPSLDLNGPFTLMCWIYPRSFSSTYTSFINKYFNYILQTTSSGSGLRLAFDIAGGGAHAANSPNGTLTLYQWQHIVGVWDGSTIKVYRNGIEVGSSYQGNLTPQVQDNPLHIGTERAMSQFFHGTIDHVKIFRGALTASQIQQEFAGFVCGDASGDATVDISDAVSLIAYIFSGGPAPSPLDAGDANCDSTVDISDVVYLIAYIFSGGPAPCAGCK
jgi:hypothetical protein